MSYDSQERRRAWESEQRMEEERDEARDLCRRMREFISLGAEVTEERRVRFNGVCFDWSERDWMQNEGPNPYLPPEDAEQLRKLEARRRPSNAATEQHQWLDE